MVLCSNAHFPHRLDNDGVYHSFCRACFRTVASSRREADLADGEREHAVRTAFLRSFDLGRARSHG